MSLHAIATSTLFLYLIAAVLQCLSFIRQSLTLKKYVFVLGFAALCLHAILLHIWIDMMAGQNLNISNLFSLTAWLVALIIWAVALRKPITALFIFVFPVCALSIFFILCFPKPMLVNTLSHPLALFHILLGIISFCIFCVAGLLSILLAIQEGCLRHKRMLSLIAQFPALESMEILLFQLIQFGFVLLSIMLISSFYFYHASVYAQYFLLQKTLLTTTAWVVFAWLLLGRYYHGWHGRKAIYGTLFAVFLLFLSYYGSRFLAGN
ncbi:MAG: cytochrome c biogenesis protein CcsA [Gammaproteobacteria bacterium]|nr:cytochrome c biogenesis protein CcsA [Gammaproteobacteria bacterium]